MKITVRLSTLFWLKDVFGGTLNLAQSLKLAEGHPSVVHPLTHILCDATSHRLVDRFQ